MLESLISHSANEIVGLEYLTLLCYTKIVSKNVMSADNQQERPLRLHPWYIVGFVEGEGTFHVALYKDPRMKTKIKVIPEFHVNQSYLRLITLERIKDYFNCGYIKANHRSRVNDVTQVYVVRNLRDLSQKIIPFFERYPLISDKRKSFEYFSKVVHMIERKEHLTTTGMRYIIKLAYRMNNKGTYRQIKEKTLLTFMESPETIRQNPM